MRAFSSFGVVLAVLLAPFVAARAQQMPPDDRHLDIQVFEPAVGNRSFLTVNSAETMPKGEFTLALGMTYLQKPLTVYFVDQANGDMLKARADVVTSIVAGSLAGGYRVLDNLQIDAFLPIIFALRGDGLDAQTGQPEAGGISATGFGDLRVEAVWRFHEVGPLSFALIPAVTLPTSVSFGSNTDAFLGDRVPTFRPRVAATL